MTARAYQREMLDESLKQNIIVAMDTGSGKTQVAVLRIRAELEQRDKRVWFLVPTVELALQQKDVVNTQISGVLTKVICGADNVEAWSDQYVWDGILLNVRVVVSTYQILFDAAAHGFVPLSSLGLIVIDEAHNCVKNNSVARFMTELYWPAKKANRPVPHILGLTASPLMRNKLDDLEVLEVTLDAICKTPTKYRVELLAEVNRPEMHTIVYGDSSDPAVSPTQNMVSLFHAYRQLDITCDPKVLSLRAKNTTLSSSELRDVMQKRSTYCQATMRAFCNRAKEILASIGPWAADYYIRRVVTILLSPSRVRDEQVADLSSAERRYLGEASKKIDTSLPSVESIDLAKKTQSLIEILNSQQHENLLGIVFVKERVTASIIAHLISIHPLTKDRYAVGAMVGNSNPAGKKRDFLELSRKEDLNSLERFRNGELNLLVATSVLEEGIDVPKCNLVICFDEPKTLKSYIQRRGRARMSVSKLYLMVPDETSELAVNFRALEQEMKRRYEDDMRDRTIRQSFEEREHPDYPALEVESTGARLTIQDAKSHLSHFCATLPSRKFVNSNPYYVVKTVDGKPIEPSRPSLLKAIVHLPASLDPEMRRFESSRFWYSETMACNDAAFQAYLKLFEVGLINNNLLPLRVSDLLRQVEHRDGIAEVKEQQNPWINVAQKWAEADLSRRRLTISNQDRSMCVEIDVELPLPVPYMDPLTLYWDSGEPWTVTMDPDTHMSNPRDAIDESKVDHTHDILSMAFGHRNGWTDAGKQHLIRLVSPNLGVNAQDMETIEDSPNSIQNIAPSSIVREPSDDNHPYYYQEWLQSKPPKDTVRRFHHKRPRQDAESWFESLPQDIHYVAVRDWPKKAGFFQKPEQANDIVAGRRLYPRIIPADLVKVDSAPAVLPHVGMLIPAITHALEVHLVASDMLETVLEQTGFTDLSLLVTAISASSARGPTDYERVEFLGDSILKFCTTVNCSAKQLLWPEGYLSSYKDEIVANSRLFQAAVDFGLDRYIITRQFKIRKPVYVEDLVEVSPLEHMKKTRMLPVKTLADVIEALIGAYFITGGIPKALECMNIFLPDVKWDSIESTRAILFKNARSNIPLPVMMQPVEELIGYKFKKKSLLVEALTHGSYNLNSDTPCLERLEFLGDAVLDYVVVTTLFNDKGLKNKDMHLLKTALVNGDIMAFMVMEWSISQERVEVVGGPRGSSSSSSSSTTNSGDETESKRLEVGTGKVPLKMTTTKLPLWSFMRHASSDLGLSMKVTQKRHRAMRAGILAALETGTHYPWADLLRLRAQKFYSDVFESVLGAVWVDSGSVDECVKLVERSGIMPLMRRLMRDDVHVLHPKEELSLLAGLALEYRDREAVSKESEKAKEFGCKVVVDGEVLADVDGAFTKEEARTRAAGEAVRVWKERRGG